jgi:hypothetical protein
MKFIEFNKRHINIDKIVCFFIEEFQLGYQVILKGEGFMIGEPFIKRESAEYYLDQLLQEINGHKE